MIDFDRRKVLFMKSLCVYQSANFAFGNLFFDMKKTMNYWSTGFRYSIFS